MGLWIPILWTSHHFLLSFPFLFITGAQLFYFFSFISHEVNLMCYFFGPWAVINFEPQHWILAVVGGIVVLMHFLVTPQ